MFRIPIKEINAEYPAETKFLKSIQRTVRESCLAAGLPDRETAAVLLAIEEGASNIIRHAYLYEKGVIRLRIVIYKKQIVFSLIDFGRPFQPSGNGRIDLKQLVESKRKGGLGFYMIRKIMDSVEVIMSGGYNELRMIKRIRPAAAGTIPFLSRMFSLRVRFSVWTFLIVFIIVGGSYYYIDRQTSQQLYAHLHDTVTSLTNTIAEQASGYILNRRSDAEFDELVVSYVRSNEEFLRQVVLTDREGSILAHSDDIRNIRRQYRPPPTVNDSAFGAAQSYRLEGRKLFYLVVPIRTGSDRVGRVHVSYSAGNIQGDLAGARQKTALLTAILLLFGIAGVFLLSSYFVGPIVKITQRVRKFASGDLASELPLEGAEEFFEISRAFNQLTTRVNQDQEHVAERERMLKEIEVASHIQKTLLPRQFPKVPGLEIEAFYRAASTVSGDLYDIFQVDPTHYCLTVADVSGKGVPASLVMSMLRTVIQIQAPRASSARDILISVYDYLKGNIPGGMFITVMLALYETTEQRLNFVSAGHNPMVYYSFERDTLEKLNPTGMPMGLPTAVDTTFEQRLQEKSIMLGDGDLFLMFTDGITEAGNREGEHYGMDRFIRFVQSQVTDGIGVSSAAISERLVNDLDGFAGQTGIADDITFIVARVRKPTN